MLVSCWLLTTGENMSGSDNVDVNNIGDVLTEHYMRIVMTAYWANSSPSTEITYFSVHRSLITLGAIEMLEADVLALLTANITEAPLRMILVHRSEVQLSSAEIDSLGWRAVSN